jgi:hypothetical protein
LAPWGAGVWVWMRVLYTGEKSSLRLRPLTSLQLRPLTSCELRPQTSSILWPHTPATLRSETSVAPRTRRLQLVLPPLYFVAYRFACSCVCCCASGCLLACRVLYMFLGTRSAWDCYSTWALDMWSVRARVQIIEVNNICGIQSYRDTFLDEN